MTGLRARLGGRLRRPGTSLLVVLLVLGGGLGAATATAPDRSAGRPGGQLAARTSSGGEVALARTTLACPDPVVDAEAGTATTLAVAATGPLGQEGGGAFRLAPLDGGAALVAGRAPGSGRAEAGPDVGPVLARGTGRSAPGLAASQLTRSTDATMRGLAGVDCAPSAAETWFVGSGSVVGQRGRVYLTNTEAAPAVVDVTIFGPDGPIEAPDARGVTVAPGAQEVRLLDALAPGVSRVAVQVRARQGRVSAAVRDQQVDGLTPRGADWVPPTTAPARRLVVAGVPGGAGQRLLQITAPGESDAIVRLRLVTPSGSFAPAGLDVVEVRAGTVDEVDLAPFTEGEAVSVALEADVPVTAGVLSRLTGAEGSLEEIAYAAAVDPLAADRPGVVADVRAGAGVASRLLLTAPQGAARVRLSALPPATGTARVVEVDAGSVLVDDLAGVAADESYALLVRPLPGSGPVLAVRQLEQADERGALVTSSPVPPGRFVVPVPRVVPDLTAGLPGSG